MRSSIHGTFATLLLLIPVGAIPALAIFGIPQFAPVVASPLHEGHERDRERRVGESARAPADELFPDDAEFPLHDDDTPLMPGRKGDSVPVPQRSGARNSNRQSEFSEPGSRIPSWGDDAAVDDRKPTVPRRNDSKLDRFAKVGDPPPRGNVESNRFAPRSFDSHEEASSFPQITTPRDSAGTQFQGGESVAPNGPQSYQRVRNAAPEQGKAVTPEETPRDSLSWQGALRRLNELEIRNFRLEPSRQSNHFVFICSYTPTDSPRVSYRFEAESEEPLKAVEKVLAQIDEWQHQRQ